MLCFNISFCVIKCTLYLSISFLYYYMYVIPQYLLSVLLCKHSTLMSLSVLLYIHYTSISLFYIIKFMLYLNISYVIIFKLYFNIFFLYYYIYILL